MLNKKLVKDNQNVYVWNTFFYERLSASNTSFKKVVERWAKRAKIDIFKLDKMIVPIHDKGNHWTFACVNFRTSVITYYDSLGGDGKNHLDKLYSYLKEYYKKHNDNNIMERNFNLVSYETTPRQLNYTDCGVFMSMFIKSVCFGKDIHLIEQQFVPKYRVQMILEIKDGILREM